MKLCANCVNCKKEMFVKSFASTRVDLEMDKGKNFKLKAQGCGRDQNVHINDVTNG